MVQPEALKKSVADTWVGLLAGIGQRFLDFCERFGSHFRRRTRTVEAPARHYMRGLLQAETKNMERGVAVGGGSGSSPPVASARAPGNRRPDRDQVPPQQGCGGHPGAPLGVPARPALLDRTHLGNRANRTSGWATIQCAADATGAAGAAGAITCSLAMMAMLFLLEERRLHPQARRCCAVEISGRC